MFPTRNLAKFQKIQRGLYNEKEQRFIVDPPKLPEIEKMIKGHWISNKCHVLICGVPCENCFKKLQNCPQRPVLEEVPWEVKIQPAKATKTAPVVEEEKGDDEGHDARPRRNRKKPKKYAPERKVSKRNRSPSIVVVTPEKDQTKAKVQVQKAATMVVDMSNGEKESSPECEPDESQLEEAQKRARKRPRSLKIRKKKGQKTKIKNNQMDLRSLKLKMTHKKSILKISPRKLRSKGKMPRKKQRPRKRQTPK